MFRQARKYLHSPTVHLPDRRWPTRVLTAAPKWCSVDLRDGNQALPEPMDLRRKLRMFRLLVALGFKEIEVGFPSASQVDFDFVRALIDEGHVPEDVTIQVITQSREHLICRTIDALRGARRAIVNLYNSTSELQRRVVFAMNRGQVIGLALRGVETIKQQARNLGGTDVILQYAPESFSRTEPDFAAEICAAVLDTWGASAAAPVIINLPATVEAATPNIYADQIEWFCRNLPGRERAVISIHPHNDRGTAVAAAELGQLAGAERVEGTLFGNGERAGNVDLVTLALNLLTQGIDPQLDLGRIDNVVSIAEECNRLPVHPRHPYAGELVYTTFAGSHQDAIHKGLQAQNSRPDDRWEVPYLPLDPVDIGRDHGTLVRLNSQSGKGGVAYVMQRFFGMDLPRGLLVALASAVQALAEQQGGEIAPERVWDLFASMFLDGPRAPVKLTRYCALAATGRDYSAEVACHVTVCGQPMLLWGSGETLTEAVLSAVATLSEAPLRLNDLIVQQRADTPSVSHVAYAELSAEDGSNWWGVATGEDASMAQMQAVVAAAGRALSQPTVGGAFGKFASTGTGELQHTEKVRA